jgi:hypothetical protein
MKSVLLVSILLLASAAAYGDDLTDLGLSPACSDKVALAVQKQCNQDSRSDKSREHGCLYSQLYNAKKENDSVSFEVDFTVTDADVYSYAVDVSDISKCTFTFEGRN